ncbi:MAG: hypothetical protein PHG05_04570 [Candidatus Nanoarchaeia archaeon]|nr:hypothetical protein [Candidatus Nanoarchaeia archaeon]
MSVKEHPEIILMRHSECQEKQEGASIIKENLTMKGIEKVLGFGKIVKKNIIEINSSEEPRALATAYLLGKSAKGEEIENNALSYLSSLPNLRGLDNAEYNKILDYFKINKVIVTSDLNPIDITEEFRKEIMQKELGDKYKDRNARVGYVVTHNDPVECPVGKAACAISYVLESKIKEFDGDDGSIFAVSHAPNLESWLEEQQEGAFIEILGYKSLKQLEPIKIFRCGNVYVAQIETRNKELQIPESKIKYQAEQYSLGMMLKDIDNNTPV